jgi:hypothetical protein
MNLAMTMDLPRASVISCGNRILYHEDVFKRHEKRFFHVGKRVVYAEVIKAGIPGNSVINIIHSEGTCALPAGVKIEKPNANLMRGFLIDQPCETKLKSGGYLEGIDKDGKKVKLDTAEHGGMSVGAKHTEGGIKGVVDNNQTIEIEDREPVLVEGVNDDPAIDTFEGKQMTAKQTLAALNVDNGGKDFAVGGETGTAARPLPFNSRQIILTAPISSNPKKYDWNGKQMTGMEIASAINVRNKGVAFDKGGQACGCNN